MLSAKHMISARHRRYGGVVVNPSSDTPLAQLRIAKRKWRGLTHARFTELRALLQRYRFSVALGEVTNIDNHWYVTHSGLIQLAFRRRCDGLETTLEDKVSDPVANRWVFKAIVHRSKSSKGFVGYGDAEPSNVSAAVIVSR
jgi:hypothetical protein